MVYGIFNNSVTIIVMKVYNSAMPNLMKQSGYVHYIYYIVSAIRLNFQRTENTKCIQRWFLLSWLSSQQSWSLKFFVLRASSHTLTQKRENKPILIYWRKKDNL